MYEVVSQRLKRCPQHELCCKSFALCPIVSYSFLQRGNFLIHCSKTTTMRKLLAKNFRPNLELLYIHNFVAKTLANEFLVYSQWPVTSLNKFFRLFLNFPQKTSFFPYTWPRIFFGFAWRHRETGISFHMKFDANLCWILIVYLNPVNRS